MMDENKFIDSLNIGDAIYEDQHDVPNTWWFKRKEDIARYNNKNRYLLEQCYDLNLNAAKFRKAVKEGRQAFELAKMFNITPEEARIVARKRGYRLETSEREPIYEAYSSPYCLFDGMGLIYRALDTAGWDHTEAAERCEMNKYELEDLLNFRRQITRERLIKLEKGLKVYLHPRLYYASKDAYNIMEYGHDIKTTQTLLNKRHDELPYFAQEKQLIVRTHLAALRVERGITIPRMAVIAKMYDWQYLQIETCHRGFTPALAKKLAFIFCIKDYRLLYVAEPMPVNYVYELRRLIYGLE